uniref:leukocyte elastase inhibitor-like n=1 Tax=Styela clava TaxID=7725 RepID=UPI0019393C3D|nr:leukocyte elastase inhibitor-like [Styela clava]
MLRLILLSLLLTAVVTGQKGRRERECSVVKAGYQFSFDLYNELASNNKGANIFFSPYSISTATSMLMLGTDGKTEIELRSFLRHGICNHESMRIHLANKYISKLMSEPVADMSLTVANRLFPDTKFNLYANYTQKSAEFYGSAVESIDFKGQHELSRKTINDWIAERTNDKIQNMLPAGSITPMTEIVLANAIYFKGTWKTKFNPRSTTDGLFHVDENTATFIPMMRTKAKFSYATNALFSIIEMPYIGDAASMVIVLPRDRFGLSSIEKMLDGNFLRALTQYGEKTEVSVTLPKFTMTFSANLEDTYQSMGVESIFSKAADFGRMTDSEDFFISNIRHKAFIEVNEEGTEAAAATTLTGARTLRRSPNFICDHPFIFYIVHKKTNVILFLGRYVTPTK